MSTETNAELAQKLRQAADVLDPHKPKIYTDPIPEHHEGRLCWLRLRRHRWSEEYDRMFHRWKVCLDCGHARRTAHLSCSVGCWGGPA